MAIARSDITGAVLAGGQGARMGGADKGLQPFRGTPLAQHALERLKPQVGSRIVNANRHLESYRAMGVPVWPDAEGGFQGPLAGILASLQHCDTGWLVTVPCDAPHFPHDLVARLSAAVHDASAAAAVVEAPDEAGVVRLQSVFLMLRARLAPGLASALGGGERKVERWLSAVGCVRVRYDDSEPFANLNTLEELRALEAGPVR